MKPIARLTDMHQCPVHGLNSITSAATSSCCDGQPIAIVGDRTACGAIILEGAQPLVVNGRAAAHIGSKTSHGGVIVTGSRNMKA